MHLSGRTEEIMSALAISSSGINLIRFNPAVDLEPPYLKSNTSFLEVNAFIDQAFYYIKSRLINLIRMSKRLREGHSHGFTDFESK